MHDCPGRSSEDTFRMQDLSGAKDDPMKVGMDVMGPKICQQEDAIPIPIHTDVCWLEM